MGFHWLHVLDWDDTDVVVPVRILYLDACGAVASDEHELAFRQLNPHVAETFHDAPPLVGADDRIRTRNNVLTRYAPLLTGTHRRGGGAVQWCFAENHYVQKNLSTRAPPWSRKWESNPPLLVYETSSPPPGTFRHLCP